MYKRIFSVAVTEIIFLSEILVQLYRLKFFFIYHLNYINHRIYAVSRIAWLSDAKTRSDRGEGKRHDGDVFCTRQRQPSARRHLQAQEHLPKPCRSGLRGGAGASQADEGAKNVDCLDSPRRRKFANEAEKRGYIYIYRMSDVVSKQFPLIELTTSLASIYFLFVGFSSSRVDRLDLISNTVRFSSHESKK